MPFMLPLCASYAAEGPLEAKARLRGDGAVVLTLRDQWEVAGVYAASLTSPRAMPPRWLLWVIVSCAPAGFPRPTDANPVVEFHFAPPASTSCDRTTIIRRERKHADWKSEKDRVRSQHTIQWRATATGYQMVVAARTLNSFTNDFPVSYFVSDDASSLVLTYDVDSDGGLQRITGYEGFLDRAGSHLPYAMFSWLGKGRTQDGLLHRAQALWWLHYGLLREWVPTLGSEVIAQLDYPIVNGGALRLYARVNCARMQKCGAQKCARVEYQLHTNAGEVGIDPAAVQLGWLLPAVPDSQTDPTTDPEVAQRSVLEYEHYLALGALLGENPLLFHADLANTEISIDGHLLVNSETMLVHDERWQEEIRTRVNFLGSPNVPVESVETRRVTYDCR